MTEPETLAQRWQLIEPIGHGGMATVWRAVDLFSTAGELVAVKRMLPAISESPEFSAMFTEEARVVAALEHPHIVKFLGFDQDEKGRHFIVMEYVPGLDLGRCMRSYYDVDEPLPYQAVFGIAACVFDALGAAHERKDENGDPAPVFHRDVTPSNVLLAPDGTVKLGDFGLARAMDRVTLTTPGVVKGKLAYVAPEMVGGARASAQSDMYSFGVVLWECLAGRHLFDAKNDVELFVKVGQAKIPSLKDERPDVPEALHEVLGRILAKSPANRFARATEASALILEALGLDDLSQVAPHVVPMLEAVMSRRTVMDPNPEVASDE